MNRLDRLTIRFADPQVVANRIACEQKGVPVQPVSPNERKYADEAYLAGCLILDNWAAMQKTSKY